MDLFLCTLEEWASRGKRIIYKDIAELARVHPVTVSKWMRGQAFRDLVSQTLRDARPVLLEAADNSIAQQAVAGNLMAWEKLNAEMRLRRQDVLSPGGSSVSPSGATVNGVIVNLGIPLPAGDRSSLPPPIMRHPTTGEIIPIPPKATLPPGGAHAAATSVGV